MRQGGQGGQGGQGRQGGGFTTPDSRLPTPDSPQLPHPSSLI
ncbi:MAG: hypothetical protein N4J56_000297 [Chroococcidiopsis sp. SAG 2025]|nr:hypothetical protein [Chroococcidiopsis sp. SAG 2025]MDV2990643.1 hypothetical protein [Chroococcidiopsis sp. SAG 2025]